jgi:glycerol-3-phosphate acyltransferase PlsY
MQLVYQILMILAAYLLGAIPTSIWIGKRFYNIDIREHGSGNAGATNTIRVLGWKPGIPVLLFDIFKGWLAVHLIYLLQFYTPGSAAFVNFQIILGVAATLGHIFPVYARFRGGKGVSTLVGIVLAIDPFSTLICFCIFVLILAITKYVSLSSLIAGISFPILVIAVFRTSTISLIVFSVSVAILLILTHRKNIKRLLKGEESKADFLRIRKKKQRSEGD